MAFTTAPTLQAQLSALFRAVFSQLMSPEGQPQGLLDELVDVLAEIDYRPASPTATQASQDDANHGSCEYLRALMEDWLPELGRFCRLHSAGYASEVDFYKKQKLILRLAEEEMVCSSDFVMSMYEKRQMILDDIGDELEYTGRLRAQLDRTERSGSARELYDSLVREEDRIESSLRECEDIWRLQDEIRRAWKSRY